MTPIFIISPPRSGSTLLQKLLSTSDDISTIAEPWILLPHFYATRSEGILTEYSQSGAKSAIDDFINQLPNKIRDYHHTLNAFFTQLYRLQCHKGERYFLDKTPRYYYIAKELPEVFPNAKFIFLSRNPLDIYASAINTWCKGKLNRLDGIYSDLYDAPFLIAEALKRFPADHILIKYENLVFNTTPTLIDICNFLGIHFSESMLDNFHSNEPKGRMGDPTGSKKYELISTGSVENWKKTFRNLYRKKLMRDYLEQLGNSTIETLGYNSVSLRKEIDEIGNSCSGCIRDLLDYNSSLLRIRLKYNIMMNKKPINRWKSYRHLS